MKFSRVKVSFQTTSKVNNSSQVGSQLRAFLKHSNSVELINYFFIKYVIAGSYLLFFYLFFYYYKSIEKIFHKKEGKKKKEIARGAPEAQLLLPRVYVCVM